MTDLSKAPTPPAAEPRHAAAGPPATAEAPPLTAAEWEAAQASPEFAELRRRFRRFVFPVAALFLAWYLLYVLLANYAHGFMATPVVGTLNVGLLLGLLQFVSTFVITALYVRFADREVDPRAEALRLELGERHGSAARHGGGAS